MRNKKNTFEGVSINGYKFGEKVGEGNWATVYLVNRISTKDMYAVKAIDQSLFKKHPSLKELINTEISILKFCKNPNVVGFIEQFVHQNHQLIVLEYCNGGNLGEKLQKQGKIEEQLANAYLKQIMNGFKGLHEVKAMHRDFKVDNVMLHNNSCKIVDLGFGKLLQEEDDLVLSKLGTKFTMAPEVLQGLPYDMKADIWSIGTVYYQLLFGQYPYISNSVQGLLDKAIMGPIFPQQQKISENSKDFIEKCLTYQPSQRVSWSQLYAHPLIKQNIKGNQNKSLIRIQENQQFYVEHEKQLNKSIAIDPPSQIKKKIIKNDYIQDQSKIIVEDRQNQYKISFKYFDRPQMNEEKEKQIKNISNYSFQDEEKKINLHQFNKQKKQTEKQQQQRIKAQEFFQKEKKRIMKQIQETKRKYISEETRISFIYQYLIKQILLDKNIMERDHLLIACFILKQTVQKLIEIQQSILNKQNIFKCKEFYHFIIDGIREIESYYKSKIKIVDCYFSEIKIKTSKISKQHERQIIKLTNNQVKQKYWVQSHFQRYEISLRKLILEKKQRSLKSKLLKWSFCYNQYLRQRLNNISYHKIMNALSHFDEKRAEENLIKKQQQYKRPRFQYNSCYSSYWFYK